MKITLVQIDGRREAPATIEVDDAYMVEGGGEPFLKITVTAKNAITVEVLAPPCVLDAEALKWAARKHFMGIVPRP